MTTTMPAAALKTVLLTIVFFSLQGCTTAVVVGAVVGTAATVAIEAAKVPIKVTGAAVDAVIDDDEDDDDD